MKWSNSGGGDFEQAPVGTEVARCIRIIDLGTQKGEYQGQVTRKRQNLISWELPNTQMSEGESAGKPFMVSKFYTASLGEKANLRKDLVNWRGREFTPEELEGFDPKNILGKCCMLSITSNDKGKSRVTAVMALPKGMIVPPQVNESIYFSLDDFDLAIFDALSKGIKEMIQKSPEYAAAISPEKTAQSGAVDEEFNDDIPW